MSLEAILQTLRGLADPVAAVGMQRFFKTGPGQYGEGDRFLGLSVPKVRGLLPVTDGLSAAEILLLLDSEWHEERLLALLIWVRRFRRRPEERAEIYRHYWERTPRINNWDLVDSSAPGVVGAWLLDQDRAILYTKARSELLWDRRVAVIATQTFIRAGQFQDTLELSRLLLTDKHDLMHKACGWMLREVGQSERGLLEGFLEEHAANMPRTMLRYAIEKFAPAERHDYLGRKR